MTSYKIDRIIKEAEYFIKNQSTVRKTAKVFNVCKSTVHKDFDERLKSIDKDLYLKVKRLLEYNLSIRHLRGGLATKNKYLLKKQV